MGKSLLLVAACALFGAGGGAVWAGERIVGTNSYIAAEELFPVDYGVYWRQDNNGTFSVSEGPLENGFVRCIGAGFNIASIGSGEGICIFTTGDLAAKEDTFTWEWRMVGVGQNEWKVIGATGKYAGMRGSGTARTNTASEFRAQRMRVTEWEGEIDLP